MAEIDQCDELDTEQRVKTPVVTSTNSNFSKLKVPGRLCAPRLSPI
jgi:hypothetical protein